MPEETAYIPPSESDEGPVAAETHAKTASDLTSKPIPSRRDLLKEAVDKQLAEMGESLSPDADEGPATGTSSEAEVKPNGKSPEVKEDLKGIPKLRSILRAREEAQRVRLEAKSERDRMVQEGAAQKAVAERELAEVRHLRAQLDADRQRLERLKTHPMEAIKDLGWTQKELVDGVIREGTPEWQASQRQQAIIDRLEARLRQLDSSEAEQRQRNEANQRQQMQEQRASVVNRFLALVPQESALRMLYDEPEIVARADKIADLARERGYVAQFEEIRDYLESEAKNRLAKATGQVPIANGKTAPKSKAGSGSRTLSSSASSERRGAPKPFSELKTENERRRALEQVAKEAMRE